MDFTRTLDNKSVYIEVKSIPVLPGVHMDSTRTLCDESVQIEITSTQVLPECTWSSHGLHKDFGQ
jgi:hypothetical protein